MWLRSFTTGGALCVALLAGCASPAALHDGADLVHLTQWAPDVAQDMRYFGANNFLGRPVRGYEAPQCWLSRPAAQAVVEVQKSLQPHGLALKVFDCYRPQPAVDDFVRWGADLADQRTKPVYYPRVPKEELFKRGYIAEKSGHSRASTVDVTLVVVDVQRASQVVFGQLANGQEVDMGTPFDMFDELSHTDNPDLSHDVRRNRQWLRNVMERHGWRNLPEEWWHYTLVNEPYPQKYFTHPVR